MQLFTTNCANTFRLYFDEIETNNLQKALNDKISIRNLDLCYYIEQSLPRLFKEFKNKRVMVLNIFNDRPNINAIVLVQDIKAQFVKPKEKASLFKVSEVHFDDIEACNNWLKDKDYVYKIISKKTKDVKVIILNMSKVDQMQLAEFNGQIYTVCNIAKYILIQTADKLEKCFN